MELSEYNYYFTISIMEIKFMSIFQIHINVIHKLPYFRWLLSYTKETIDSRIMSLYAGGGSSNTAAWWVCCVGGGDLSVVDTELVRKYSFSSPRSENRGPVGRGG